MILELAGFYFAGMILTSFVFGIGGNGKLDDDDVGFFATALTLWPLFLPIFLAFLAFDWGRRIRRRTNDK